MYASRIRSRPPDEVRGGTEPPRRSGRGAVSVAALLRDLSRAGRARCTGGAGDRRHITDWADYDFTSLARLLAVIRAAPAPILGICAGHQLIGLAHGASWGPLGPLQAGEVDPDPRFVPGRRKERGFLPVEVDSCCPLFRGLDSTAAFFQSHYWQLEDVSQGFAARARSPWSPIQAIERLDRPVFGVQFHPERYDTAQPDGATVLRNFFARARGASGASQR